MDVFFAIAEPTRRNIIEILAKNGHLPATHIYDKFKVSAPAISQHLKILREANVVKVEKKAQQRIYQLNTETMEELEGWVRQMHQLWSQRFDALDKVLEAEKRKHYILHPQKSGRNEK